MSEFQEQQRAHAIALLRESSEAMDGASGGGKLGGIHREFVLDNPEKNLYRGIRAEVREYFDLNRISWWGGRRVTGHALSSQVACVNHMFAWRGNEAAATAVLQGLSPDFIKALPIECDLHNSGFVQFEAVSGHQYLNEGALTRGTQCTSIDALMFGERRDGSRWLVPIEWKFTEHYANIDRAAEGVAADPTNGKGAVRQRRYSDLIRDSKQLKSADMSVLYFEPFYQLMRQTLLVEQIVLHREQESLQADSFLHVHVIPSRNRDLLDKRYRCSGLNMEQTWRRQLQDQSRYRIVDPVDLLAPLLGSSEFVPLMSYLGERYWEASGTNEAQTVAKVGIPEAGAGQT